VSIGETLSAARQRAGLSVGQVSESTRIRGAVIRAIERDDFSLSGGDFYARGHVRAIAQAVGADAAPLVQEYDDAHGGAPQPTSAVEVFEPETPIKMGERRRPNWAAAMAVALIVVVAFGAVKLLTGGKGGDANTSADPRHSAAAPARTTTPTPTPTKSSGPVAMAPGQVTVRLSAVENTWVSVHDDGGKQLFEGLVDATAVKSWSAKKKLKLIVGNAGGVRLRVNGKDVGKPGSEGDVIRLSFGPGDPTAA
jgi:cytoskeletal protein RodZ